MIEDAVTILGLHLDDLAGDPQVFFDYLFFLNFEISDHPGQVFIVERYGCFTVAAVAATATLKDFLFQRSVTP